MAADDAIEPGRAPGGLVFRILRVRDGVILSEGMACQGDGVRPLATFQADQAVAAASDGGAILQVFDGDSGELLEQGLLLSGTVAVIGAENLN